LPALAVKEERTEAPVNGTGPRRAAGPLRIVIIEDNEDVSETLASLLEEEGHRVWVASDGPRGIEIVQQERPQIVLCDLGLPGMDGLEVCRCVRGLPLGEQPTMVALTGWGRDDDRRRTDEAGFDHHLVKPVALDKLQSVLESVE
jgi:CheY-like chemotaxis protein